MGLVEAVVALRQELDDDERAFREQEAVLVARIRRLQLQLTRT